MALGQTKEATADIQDLCDKIKARVAAAIPTNPLDHYTALQYRKGDQGSFTMYVVKILVGPGTKTSCIHIKFEQNLDTHTAVYKNLKQGFSTTSAIENFQ